LGGRPSLDIRLAPALGQAGPAAIEQLAMILEDRALDRLVTRPPKDASASKRPNSSATIVCIDILIQRLEQGLGARSL